MESIKTVTESVLDQIKDSMKDTKDLYKDEFSHEDRIRGYLKEAGVGERFLDKSFSNFSLTEENKKAYQIALDYVANFFRMEKEGKGILFLGLPGRGKTHLAVSVLRGLLEKGCLLMKSPNFPIPITLARYIKVPYLLDELRSSYQPTAMPSEQIISMHRKLANKLFLVMDDLGSEKITDWAMERIFMIIDSRYESFKPTVITSNCSLKELGEIVGERVLSRIFESSEIVEIGGKDYRRPK